MGVGLALQAQATGTCVYVTRDSHRIAAKRCHAMRCGDKYSTSDLLTITITHGSTYYQRHVKLSTRRAFTIDAASGGGSPMDCLPRVDRVFE